jgi:hypothetical protein
VGSLRRRLDRLVAEEERREQAHATTPWTPPPDEYFMKIDESPERQRALRDIFSRMGIDTIDDYLDLIERQGYGLDDPSLSPELAHLLKERREAGTWDRGGAPFIPIEP